MYHDKYFSLRSLSTFIFISTLTETKEEKELEYKKWNINALLGVNCDNSNLSSTILFIWEALLSSHQYRRIQFKLSQFKHAVVQPLL